MDRLLLSTANSHIGADLTNKKDQGFTDPLGHLGLEKVALL
jgi:hypothetical protein